LGGGVERRGEIKETQTTEDRRKEENWRALSASNSCWESSGIKSQNGSPIRRYQEARARPKKGLTGERVLFKEGRN